ncbi:MAG TPA: AsmA family protein [Candidatus Angelobacter sp.]|nr:AsmA family protein [Candidatus Angelobacter sp.]
MAVAFRKRTVLAILFVVALGIFLPPNINGARFKSRLASTLSAALGRPVKIGSVRFRLLPRPGFDLYDFVVADDPAFNAEPLLLCGKVTADLRLTSLWQGRLEIANLKLQNAAGSVPPSLNLVYLNGHWNMESLLARAEQVPTAPTAKKRAEQRARFPYIEADAGRINIKIGPEKKPYALVNTDFAFWLAAEDLWHLRLQGQPVRTDMNLTDTGKIKIEGDLKRSSDWQQTPVKFQLSWDEGQLGQLSKLAAGQDKGWRGAVDMKAELTGTFLEMHLTAQAGLRDFRRYDIDRRGMFALNASCLGEYSQGLLDFDCSVPVESGGIRVSGKLSPASPQNYDLSLVANRVPLLAVATFARYAKRTLPDDLTASGQLDAAFAFHSHDDMPQDWHGAGSTSPFVVRSISASAPIQVTGIHFHLGSLDRTPDRTPDKTKETHPPQMRGKVVKTVQADEGRSLTFDPFSIQLGTGGAMQVQGNFRPAYYSLAVKGTAPLERILDLGNISGFRSRIKNAAGAVNLDLSIHGQWANFAPARLGGTAHLENVTAAIPGVRERLLMPTADVHFSESEAVLIAAAQFEHSPVALAGSISNPVNCLSEAPCPLQFDLHADSLATQDVAGLLGVSQSGWRLPFISTPENLPDFRASGTLSVASFRAGGLPVEEFIAHLEVGEHALLLDHINASIADGSMQGDWRIDWSTSPARYSGTGAITGVSPEHLPLPDSASSLLASWISGKTSLKYSLDLSGTNERELLANAQGHAEFTLANGVSRALTLDAARPTRFQNLQGKCEINHAVLELLESKFKAENRIYEISGTISLADKQAKLKVSNNATHWDITGTLENPNVAAQRLTAQQVSAHTQ